MKSPVQIVVQSLSHCRVALIPATLLVLQSAQATTWGSNPRSDTYIVAASNASAHSQSATYGAADATCTGSHDESTIATAIAALPSTGGRILLTEGTYNLGGAIALPPNVELHGEGVGVTILKRVSWGGASDNLVTITGTHTTISDLTIFNNHTGNTNNTGAGLYLSGATEARVKNVEVTDPGAYGVSIISSTDVHLSGCTVSGALQIGTTAGYGLYINGTSGSPSGNIIIGNCDFLDNQINGVVATYVNGLTITNSNFIGNANTAVTGQSSGGQVFLADACTNATVVGCTFNKDLATETCSVGVQVNVLSNSGQLCQKVTIASNTITNEGYAGVLLYNNSSSAHAAYCTIKNNIITDCNNQSGTDGKRSGVAAYAGLTDFVIEGNTFYDDRSTPLMTYDVDVESGVGNRYVITNNDPGHCANPTQAINDLGTGTNKAVSNIAGN